MATVGRARQTAESAHQQPVVYGEASEKDIERRQRVFLALALREPDRSHARRDETTSDAMATFNQKKFGLKLPA